jgi:molecular chaperone GrpE
VTDAPDPDAPADDVAVDTGLVDGGLVDGELVDAELVDADEDAGDDLAGAADLDGAQYGDVDAALGDAGAGDRNGYGSCEEALEDAVSSLERVTAERDDYLDVARRVQAEFENYRKRVEAQRTDQIARAAESLVVELLPVLDACDAAISHGAVDVEPILAALSGTLTKQGLAKVDLAEVPFDPNLHEAVLSEPGTGDDAEPLVAEVMRAGYQWNGRVLRPAMVKVRG